MSTNGTEMGKSKQVQTANVTVSKEVTDFGINTLLQQYLFKKNIG